MYVFRSTTELSTRFEGRRRDMTLLFLALLAIASPSNGSTDTLNTFTQNASSEGVMGTVQPDAAELCTDPGSACAERRDPHTAALIFGFFFHLPHYLIEKESKYRTDYQFLGYPYEGGAVGYMAPPVFKKGRTEPAITTSGDLLIGAEDDTVVSPYRTRPLSLRLVTDYSFDLETVHKTSAYLLFESRWRWGIEAGFSYLQERFQNGESSTHGIGIGDANIVFRFAQHRHIQMRTGFGGRYMTSPVGVKGGVNFTYGVDVYPIHPLVFSTSVDFGNLGYAFVLHGRGTLGAVLRSFEAFAGWDVLQMDDTVVHGPLVGLRTWI